MPHLVTRWTLLLSLTILSIGRGDDWPQWRGAGRAGMWRETGIITRFSSPRIALRWRVPISNGYSGPTVADGRVYVTDRVTEPQEQERIHCFDWRDGRRLWSYAYPCQYRGFGYPDGPRAAVTIAEGRAYALGATGRLHCLDAVTGKVLWRRDLNADFQIRMIHWGIAAAPLVEGDKVIVLIGGSDGACVVALDVVTGEERWRALNDRGNYAAPIAVDQAGRRVIICWTGDSVSGLDAPTGAVLWSHPFPPARMPLGIATPVVHDDLLFISGFYDGSLLLRLRQDSPAVEKLWRRRGQNERSTDALHCLISTPLILGDYIYGVDSYGELRCLKLANGDRVWEDQTATPRNRWSTVHMVQNGERTWMFNERGELIIARLSPDGFHELSRAKLIEPTLGQLRHRTRDGVCWSHPAFAYRHVFARNDSELVCASLATE